MELFTEEVVYRAGGTALRGYLARDGAVKEKRPGVLVVHEWWGHDEHVRERARQLARAGHVALAVDMYGDGKKATSPQEAGALMTAVVSDLPLMRARFEAARALLAADPAVDASRLGAVGFCFGGTVVLQMARLGLELAAVAAFHPGTLATTQPAQRGTFRAQTLVCLGADDPFVPAEERQAFRREMDSAGVTLEYVEYPGVVHGFTVAAATERGKEYGLPLAFDAAAEQDAWTRLGQLFARAFGRQT